MSVPFQIAASSRRAWATIGQALALLALLIPVCWLGSLHARTGWPGAPAPDRWLPAMAVLLGYAGLCLAAAGPRLRNRSRRRLPTDAPKTSTIAVVWASQTGTAIELAETAAERLSTGIGIPVPAYALERLEPSALVPGTRLLFVVSTTGEGDPPNHALDFATRSMGALAGLDGIRYGLLALGDRRYAGFCAFGHALHRWLRVSGAQALFAPIEVDDGDPVALARWQFKLDTLVAEGVGRPVFEQPVLEQPTDTRLRPSVRVHRRRSPRSVERAGRAAWRLHARERLDSGSGGHPVYRVELQASARILTEWQAGDIVCIRPRNDPGAIERWLHSGGLDGRKAIDSAAGTMPLWDWLARVRLPALPAPGDTGVVRAIAGLAPLPLREYSIATLPSEGRLELLVRLMPAVCEGSDALAQDLSAQTDAGPWGLGSGWLCRHARIGDPIELRIRRNPGFHPPATESPMILIGNGTGIAGLRAHLVARQARGANRNWLLFGERSSACAGFYRDELQHWHAAGGLAHLDYAWSRDPGDGRYVQHLLAEHAERLRAWIDDGAVVYVCGSRIGMAPAVDAVLRDLLGAGAVDRLRRTGCYRRDVY